MAVAAGAASPRQPALRGERSLLSHSDRVYLSHCYELQRFTLVQLGFGWPFLDCCVLLENMFIQRHHSCQAPSPHPVPSGEINTRRRPSLLSLWAARLSSSRCSSSIPNPHHLTGESHLVGYLSHGIYLKL